MIRILRTIAFVLIVVVAALKTNAQPFIAEIQAFKKQDSISSPAKNAVLFVGSSSFRKWTDVQSYFPNRTIINRGFGGSTLPDVIRYANDIILPYHPKQVVIYCGDNDLASSDTVTATTVTSRFKELFNIVRNGLPKATITYVSIKPSPSRAKLRSKMEEANSMIKDFLKTQKRTSFIDVYNPMLMANGKPKPEIFLGDSLHMNEKGYAIWKKEMKRYLKK